MLPNILQSHAPVFTGKERRLDSRFSNDNLQPFTPHCRWDDAEHQQLRAGGQCNLPFAFFLFG